MELPVPLSKKEQEEYFIRYRLYGDPEAKEKLIKHNMRLVVKKVYSSFYGSSYELEDLISLGYLALVQSVMKYDIDKGTSFSNYVYKAIDNTIIKYMKSESKHFDVNHLDNPVSSTTNNEFTKSYLDIIGTEETGFESVLINDEYKVVREIVESLPEKQKIVVKELYGFDDGETHTLMEVGEKLSMTYQNVSKIARNTLPIIKNKLEKTDESYKRLVKRR